MSVEKNLKDLTNPSIQKSGIGYPTTTIQNFLKKLPYETRIEYSNRIKDQLINLVNVINKEQIIIDSFTRILFARRNCFYNWRF